MAIPVVDGFVITNATPVDARLVFTSSAALFDEGDYAPLPAVRRYLGMEVYIVPETCSYTLISGDPRGGGGIINGIWCTGSVTSSYALTASQAISASWAPAAGLVTGGTYLITASWAQTASYALNGVSGSGGSNLATGSTYPFTSSQAITSSYAKTASFWDSSSIISILNNKQWNIATGSLLPVTASQAISASWAPDNGKSNLETGSTYPITASWATQTSTASYFTGSGTNNYYPKWFNGELTKTSSIFDNGLNVGIGTITGLSSAQLYVYQSTSSTESASAYAQIVRLDTNSGFVSESKGKFAALKVIGHGAGSENYTDSEIGITGLWVVSDSSLGTDLTASLIQGALIETYNSASGYASEIRGITIKIGNTSAGAGTEDGNVESVYAVYISPYVSSKSPSIGQYGIYQAGTSDRNYFAGNIGVGTDPMTAPTNFKLKTAGHVGPSVDRTYDLGSTAYYWNRAYINAITGSLDGTASWAITASYALTASYISSAYAMVGTASYAIMAGTASWAWNVVNGGSGLATGSTYPFTASWALTASYVQGMGAGLSTGSTYPITASWAQSASYWNSSSIASILNNKQWNIATGSTLPITASVALNALSSSWADSSLTASYFISYSGSMAWRMFVNPTGDLVFQYS